MNPLLTTCPVCHEPLSVVRLHCRNCDTAIEGRFETGRWGMLSPEQLNFLETFLRCEGKFTRMEKELGLSYPTLRSRFTEVLRQMGFSVEAEEPPAPTEEQRHRILDELASGKISSEDAMRLLEGA